METKTETQKAPRQLAPNRSRAIRQTDDWGCMPTTAVIHVYYVYTLLPNLSYGPLRTHSDHSPP